MSSSDYSYRQHLENSDYMARYLSHQKQYFSNLRESDKVLISLLQPWLSRENQNIVDVGCSSGALLRALRNPSPDHRLVGIDNGVSVIETNLQNPELEGIEFYNHDLFKLDLRIQDFDIVIVNAVLQCFSLPEYQEALRSLCAVLKPGGVLIAFDHHTPFDQNFSIFEESLIYPSGVMLSVRSYRTTKESAVLAGFSSVEIHPFEIPIDLPRSADLSDLTTHTVRTEEGKRLNFRGAFYEPWCHVIAIK